MTIQGGWFPRNMLDISERLQDPNQAAQASKDIHDAMRYTIQGVYTVQNNLNTANTTLTTAAATALATAQKVAAGTAITSAGPGPSTGAVTVPTGLTTVSVVVACVKGAGLSNIWIVAQPSATPGSVDIVTLMPTAVGNTTPAAAPSIPVSWIAYGTK
jgi:NAD-dependent DNA ligase